MAIVKYKRIINEKFLSEFAPFKSNNEYYIFMRRFKQGIYNKTDLLNKYLNCKKHIQYFIKSNKRPEEVILTKEFNTPYKFNIGEYILGYKILKVEYINDDITYTIDKIEEIDKENININCINDAINELQKI